MPRDRSPSYSPRHSPRRSYSPPPRRQPPRSERDRNGEPRTSLLVRNLPRDSSLRPDDLRAPFERYGPIKDIYLPKDYHTGEPRGFGFVQFVDPEDAQEAAYYLDGKVIGGRQVTVVFAEESRKKPQDMRTRERGRYGGYSGSDRRRSPHRRFSPSRSPYRRHSRSPAGRRYSRSPPRRSPSRSRSPAHGGRGAALRSRSLPYEDSPRRQGPSSGDDRSGGMGNGGVYNDEY
eukprot:TRINITY_DN649_c0_g1_i1.p1 TRINITY_DN649_c0_g1~~TRINITY_DN649_c0_g1_i1.p1  ORF type:complete len:232 (-),score=15.19 TRINITY_DN649_c0_g1_i1:614-1309(-)